MLVDDHDAAQFGDLRLIQSRYQSNRAWFDLKDLTPEKCDQNVWIRARVHAVRQKGIVVELFVL